MSKNLAAQIKTPKEAFGSEAYIVNLKITNLSNKSISIMSIEAQSLLGKIKQNDDLIEREDTDISDYDRLNTSKIMIINEMEDIIRKAYNKSISKYKTFYGTMTYTSDDYMESYKIKQALRIENWEDVERLEKMYLTDATEDMQSLYTLNKEKLKEILDKQQGIENQGSEQKKEEEETFKAKYVIQPGETILFPFEAVAPFLRRAQSFTFQFKVSYQDPSNNTIANFSVDEEFTFYPSTKAIYLGSVLGGIAGFIVRNALSENTVPLPSNFGAYLFNFIGSIALALIFTAFTVRTPSSKKVITTEDFIGGFILGAFVGIASTTIHSYLLKVVPN